MIRRFMRWVRASRRRHQLDIAAARALKAVTTAAERVADVEELIAELRELSQPTRCHACFHEHDHEPTCPLRNE